MRGRVAYLNTDLSAHMKSIEAKLAELHAFHRPSDDTDMASQNVSDKHATTQEEIKTDGNAPTGATETNSASASAGVEPCIWITDVVEESPAANAGLLLGDAVLKFGEFVPTK